MAVAPAPRWNVGKFALWGGVFGVAVQLAKIVTGQAETSDSLPLLVTLASGATGGAIALALVAFMRNLMTPTR